MIGYVNYFETTGMVDGPGIRFVVFLSGCNLRCLFCHNPESWYIDNNQKISANDLMNQILKYKDYYENGGVTFSGGEPLIQSEFLIKMLKLCKKNNLHTAIDTAGVGSGNYEDILKYTDLILLDIKSYQEKQYKEITGKNMNDFKTFINALNNSNKPVWIRQVIIPDINDTKEYIIGLKEYLKGISNVEKIELLPYHSLGKEKYEKLHLEYKLKDVNDLTDTKLNDLKEYLK